MKGKLNRKDLASILELDQLNQAYMVKKLSHKRRDVLMKYLDDYPLLPF